MWTLFPFVSFVAMNTSKAEEEDPEDGENSRCIRTRGTLRRQKNNSSIPSPSRSPSPQIPKIRKLGHAPQSVCETGVGCGSRAGDEPTPAECPASEGVPLLDATKLHPLSFSQESADPVSGSTCALTPARSVPDMETHKSKCSYLPYTKLDSVTQKYPRQLSSQTASFASEGSQVVKVYFDVNSIDLMIDIHVDVFSGISVLFRKVSSAFTNQVPKSISTSST